MSNIPEFALNEQKITLLMENGPGDMDIKAFIMQKSNEWPPRILVTYQVSDSEGEEVDAGFEDEEGVIMLPDAEDILEGLTQVSKAYDYLQNNNASEASASFFHPGVWYSTEWHSDIRTGQQEQRSFHLKGFTAAEEQEVYELWHAMIKRQ